MFGKDRNGGNILESSDGHFYRRNASKMHHGGFKQYWICSKRNTLKCLARAVTVDDKVMQWSGLHNHNPPKIL